MTDLAAARFAIIAPLLRRYKRRFTLLDLGAGIHPYMTQRIGNDFDALVIAVEQDEIVPAECAKFGLHTLWLRKSVTPMDLERLACCEHFDVALALNFLHHFGDGWRDAAKSFERMTSLAIVQTPYSDDSASCGQEIIPTINEWLSFFTHIGESVQFDGHMPRPIYMKGNMQRARLTMTNWTSPENCCDVRISTGFTSKTIQLVHKDGKLKPYIHGFNLWNFVMLGGAWPRKDVVLKLIREFPLPKEHHGDITAHNFLFDGKELFLIDGHEGWEFSDEYGLKQTEQMVGDLLC